MDDIVRLLPSQIDEYVRSRLKAEGFDMDREIISYEDIFMRQIVFKQDVNTEGMKGAGANGGYDVNSNADDVVNSHNNTC